MSILYPASQLKIMDYNRVLLTLNGLLGHNFLDLLEIQGISHKLIDLKGDIENARPKQQHEFSAYIDKKWYKCTISPELIPKNDPVKSLDVQLLNDLVLNPVLGIKDLRTDKRIDFVGGIRGLQELERRCNEDAQVAFAMHPVQIEDLINVADSGLIMPPKSTWFEPKPRSGFVTRVFNE